MSSLTISITEIDLSRSPSDAGRSEADFRLARLADGEEGPGVAGELREFLRVVDEQILRRRAGKKNSREGRRNIAEQRAGNIQKIASSALFFAGEGGRPFGGARIIHDSTPECRDFAR